MFEQTKVSDWKYLAIAVVLFILSYPFIFWGIMSNRIIPLAVKTILSIYIVIYCRRRFSDGDYKLLFVYELAFVIDIVLELYRGSSNTNGFVSQLPVCLFVSICFMETTGIKKTMYYLMNIILIISIIGLFFYLINQFYLSLPPFGIINHFNQDRTYMVYPLYLVELFDNPVETADTVSIMRFQGVYDEAGLLGTILAFFIYTLGYNFKNWRTWACIIVGVFTFSFFFYTMTVVFWAVNAIVRKKRAYSFVFALVLFGGFYLMTKDSTMFQDVIWNRFEWNTENSSFEGDNRMTEEGEAEYNKIKGTSEYWLGLKAEHAKSFWASAEGSSSYKAVVANKGMVFFAIYTLFILLLGWYNRSTKESFLLYAVFMIVCIYQRTNVYSVLFLFLYSALARLQLGRGDLLRP